MRGCRALCTAGIFLWTSFFPDGRSTRAQEPGKQESPKQDLAPPAAQKPVRLADGSRAKLRAFQESKGQGKQGVMTAAMIGTGILFFPVAPMFLFMRGKDTVIAQGTPISTYIDGNTELLRENFIGAEPSSEKPAAPPTEKREESPADPAPATSQNQKPSPSRGPYATFL